MPRKERERGKGKKRQVDNLKESLKDRKGRMNIIKGR